MVQISDWKDWRLLILLFIQWICLCTLVAIELVSPPEPLRAGDPLHPTLHLPKLPPTTDMAPSAPVHSPPLLPPVLCPPSVLSSHSACKAKIASEKTSSGERTETNTGSESDSKHRQDEFWKFEVTLRVEKFAEVSLWAVWLLQILDYLFGL